LSGPVDVLCYHDQGVLESKDERPRTVRNGARDLALDTDLQRTDQGTKNYDVGSNHRDQGA
jgi:hypothetical protein